MIVFNLRGRSFDFGVAFEASRMGGLFEFRFEARSGSFDRTNRTKLTIEGQWLFLVFWRTK